MVVFIRPRVAAVVSAGWASSPPGAPAFIAPPGGGLRGVPAQVDGWLIPMKTRSFWPGSSCTVPAAAAAFWQAMTASIASRSFPGRWYTTTWHLEMAGSSDS